MNVFLNSNDAGGLEINLAAVADAVILHDLDFNPTTDRQAEDRVHRIGQTKEVKIYKLVAKGTVDAGIYAVAERKRKLEAQLLGEDGDEKGGAAPRRLRLARSSWVSWYY